MPRITVGLFLINPESLSIRGYTQVSLKQFLLILLPLKAVLVQLTTVSSVLGVLNPSHLISIGLFGVTAFFLVLNFSQIMAGVTTRNIFVLSMLLFVALSLQPIFSYMFTQNINDFAEVLKLYSWISLIPLAALAFKTNAEINQLRVSAIFSFCIIVGSLAIANFYSIGDTAYDLGLFYIGWFHNEATLSVSLAIFAPLFLLPGGSQERKVVGFTKLVLVGLIFILVILVMKRASVLAMLLEVSVMLLLFKRNPLIGFSNKSFWLLTLSGLLFFFACLVFVIFTYPEALENRFLDVELAEQSGDVRWLGAGRVGLAELYMNDFLRSGIPQQIFGVDITGYVDTRKEGYLHMGKTRTVPHNDYLDILARGGIISLILFVILLARLFLLVVNQYRKARNPLAAHLAAITLGAFAMYSVYSVDGTTFQVLTMAALGLLLGATIGVGSNLDPKQNLGNAHR